MEEKDLVPLSVLNPLREISRQSVVGRVVNEFEIPFSARASDRFARYVETLYRLNAAPVYIWTAVTNACGSAALDSIMGFKWGFEFETTPGGVIGLMTADGMDSLLLDFWEEPSGERRLRVEAKGLHWPGGAY